MTTRKQEVIREFPPIGKYRIRLLWNPNKPHVDPVLDIREYVSSETFEGFTRRGIAIGDRAQIDLLMDVLSETEEYLRNTYPYPKAEPAEKTFGLRPQEIDDINEKETS